MVVSQKAISCILQSTISICQGLSNVAYCCHTSCVGTFTNSHTDVGMLRNIQMRYWDEIVSPWVVLSPPGQVTVTKGGYHTDTDHAHLWRHRGSSGHLAVQLVKSGERKEKYIQQYQSIGLLYVIFLFWNIETLNKHWNVYWFLHTYNVVCFFKSIIRAQKICLFMLIR